MSVAAGTMFKWLDLLEREFDRSFVTIDLLLGKFKYKMGCVFLIGAVSILPHAVFGIYDHQEDAPTSENDKEILTFKIQVKSTRNKVISPMKDEINWESFHLASGSLQMNIGSELEPGKFKTRVRGCWKLGSGQG